jgi:hypothetical protein
MTSAEIAVMQCRLQTQEFLNRQLNIDNEQMRLAISVLLDTLPSDVKVNYQDAIELAQRSVHRII